MKQILNISAFALGAALLTSTAVQAAQTGPYAGVRGGVNFQDDDTSFTDTTGVPGFFSTTIFTAPETDTGFNAGLVAGYGFNGWGSISPRIETEFGYLSNDTDTSNSTSDVVFFGTPLPQTASAGDDTDGEINAHYALASVLFDININSAFTPFLGGGVGFAKVRFDDITPTTGVAAGLIAADEEETVFAWNLTAGVSYELARNLTLDVSYRYLRFESVDTISTSGSNINSNDLDNHQVNLGLRVQL